MNERPPITTPGPLRWRRLRSQVLPPLCFALSTALCLWLWQQQERLPNAVGEVEAIRVDVSSLSDGQLLPLSDRPGGDWGMFDRVQEGQIIARLDSRVVWTELSALDTLLRRLSEQLASQVTLPVPEPAGSANPASAAADLALRVEQRRLARLHHLVQLQRNRMERCRLQMPQQLKREMQRRQRTTGMDAATAEKQQQQQQRQQLLAESVVHERAIKALDAELAQLNKSMPGAGPVETTESNLLTTLRPELTAITIRAEQACSQAEALEIHAPLGGTIVAVHRWRGQLVRSGDPIVTIAADQSRHVISYLAENQRVTPRVGTQVRLWPRAVRTGPVLSVVESVGPQVERIPPHHLSDSGRQRWGLPVRIRLPRDLSVRPGALLDVTFSNRTTSASEYAPN